MNNLIQDLNWRYATKKFDTTKKLDQDTLDTLKEAVRLTASSFGLQPYEVFVINNQELKNELRTVSFDQPQVSDCDYLFVFTINTNIDDDYLDRFINNIAETREMSTSDLEGMRQAISGSILQFSQQEKLEWAKRQAYIGLGNLLASAARLKVDVSPMEGFENDKYNDILNLKSKHLASAVIAGIGYRSAHDDNANAKKVRKSNEEFFNHL